MDERNFKGITEENQEGKEMSEFPDPNKNNKEVQPAKFEGIDTLGNLPAGTPITFHDGVYDVCPCPEHSKPLFEQIFGFNLFA